MKNTLSSPEFLQKPFNLTVEKFSNPAKVLENFCCQYSPLEVRLKLKDWYAASLSDEHADTKTIFTIYEDIERVIEAVYLINNQNQ